MIIVIVKNLRTGEEEEVKSENLLQLAMTLVRKYPKEKYKAVKVITDNAMDCQILQNKYGSEKVDYDPNLSDRSKN